MENKRIIKECPENTKRESEFAAQLNKQLCELARSLRACVNEIKKVSYLYEGQICDNLQQISDFKTLLHTAQKGISSDMTKGAETCQKYLIEANKQLNAFIGLMDFVKSHSDTVLKVVYGEENKKDVAWREKEKRTLYEKGMIGRKNEDGSWNIDNCRWTFEDHLIFAMESDFYKDSKDQI